MTNRDIFRIYRQAYKEAGMLDSIARAVASRNTRIKTASEKKDVKARLHEIMASKTASDPAARIAQAIASRNARIGRQGDYQRGKVNQLYMAVKQAGLGLENIPPFGWDPLSVDTGAVRGLVTDDTVPNDAVGMLNSIEAAAGKADEKVLGTPAQGSDPEGESDWSTKKKYAVGAGATVLTAGLAALLIKLRKRNQNKKKK